MPFINQISNYGSFKYVVTGSQPGPFPTIQSAIDQAHTDSATTTIFVRPGTYTENLTCYSGIDIQGSQEGQVVIIGTHVPPLTGSFSITDCTLQSDASIFVTSSSVGSNITLYNCIFALASGAVFYFPTVTGDLVINGCSDISISNAILGSGASFSSLDIINSSVGAGSSPLTVVNGIIRIVNSSIFCPIELTSGTDLYIDGSLLDIPGTGITVSQSCNASIYNSRIVTGANPCIDTTAFATFGLTTLENVILDSSATYVIDGMGLIELGSVTYNDVSAINPAVTYANVSLLSASNLNIEQILFLNGSSGTAGQILTSNGVAAPTWQAAGGGGMTWVGVATDTTIAANHGYVNGQNALTTFTLPATAVLGDTFTILNSPNYGASVAFTITVTGTFIQFGNQTATTSISSTTTSDVITCVCVYATGGAYRWQVISAIGNLTVV